MKRITTIVLSIAILCMVMAGCQKPQQSNPDTTYNMEHGLDAMGYNLFLNKQTTVVLNQMSTDMILTMRATEDTKTDTIESLQNSLSIIQAARHEVDIMCPPPEYVENRTNTLRLYDKAITDIESAITALEKSPIDTKELSSLAEQMQTNFVALTAEFNVYYK